jgi:dihydrodipicolinate synthase/N-acetylneuraminate lyase
MHTQALLGATGACCFFANWSPALVSQVMSLGMAGRHAEAQATQRLLLPADYLGMAWGTPALKAVGGPGQRLS